MTAEIPPKDVPDTLAQGLADIRQRIDELGLPVASYAAIGITDEEYVVAIVTERQTTTLSAQADSSDHHQAVLDWLRRHTTETNTKIVAAAILGGSNATELGARLWLEEDVVPYVLPAPTAVTAEVVEEAAWEVCNKFDELHLVKVPLSETNKVEVSQLVTKADYQKTVTPEAWSVLEEQVAEFAQLDNELVFFNATPQGGGVALMRHALLRCYELLGVKVHWHVLQPNNEVFQITKGKFHNVLQAVAPEDTILTEQDKEVYTAWVRDNAEFFEDVFRRARVIVIDDPQPSGMIPLIKQYNPGAKIVYRSHIHLDNELLAAPGTPQLATWQFIWQHARAAELFVSHPVQKFIPHEALENTVTMPATTDPLDGLNKELDERQMHYYLKLFNKVLLEHTQEPLDTTRDYIVQIARFDPSKGIPDVIESYAQLCARLAREGVPRPQLVIAGHGSIDDPDGVPVYNMVMQLVHSKSYAHLAADIKVVRLHHNDQILNALLRGSKVVLQLSHKEGFEVKVTEALHKGRPVIAFKAGGIPLQIESGVTGYLVDVGDCATVSEHLYHLFTDDALYARMSAAARTQVSPHYFTVHNAAKWLFIANTLVQGRVPEGSAATVSSHMEGVFAATDHPAL